MGKEMGEVSIIMVRPMRLELIQVALYAPQTYASTNSAKAATAYVLYNYLNQECKRKIFIFYLDLELTLDNKMSLR